MNEKISLNRVQIKYIAIAAMFLDHLAAFLLTPEKYPALIVLYIIMRIIGRIAAPVMFYFLVEGYEHTSSRKNYALRLLAFAILSQIPYSLVRFGKASAGDLNVIFTLLISFLMMAVTDRIKSQIIKGMAIALFMIISVFSDWGLLGPLMVWIFYMNRGDKTKQIRDYLMIICIQLICTVIFLICNTQNWYEGICQLGIFLVIPLLQFYNGESGRKTIVNKWLFYIFYPVHLIVIWLILKGYNI